MALTPEQTEVVKKQLIKHIEKGFPADKQEFAKQQIMAMNSKQLEEFLKNNKIAITDSVQRSGKPGEREQCIFCSIISGQLQSYKIAENNEAVAVLEINPISKGHVLIIPKLHVSKYDKKLSEGIKNLSDKVSKKIKKEIKAEGVVIENSNLFGHQITNIIPQYGNEKTTLKSERHPAKPEELASLQKALLIKTKKTPIKKSKPKKINPKKEKIWLPKRIP